MISFISECKYRRLRSLWWGRRGESKPRMVNIQLPVSHFILTSKIRPKSPMSVRVSQEGNTPTNRESSAFNKGSLIQLASGDTKNIEDLQTEDFIKSASICPDLSLQHSKLIRLGNHHPSNLTSIHAKVKFQLQILGIRYLGLS